MSFYAQKRLANIRIAEIVLALKKNKAIGNIPAIILEVTEKFEVSEKAVLERIELIARADAGMKITEDEITWL